MFRANKDERLMRITHRAGYIAFFSMWVLMMVMMTVGLFVNLESLAYPPVILLVPAMFGAVVFVIVASKGGMYSTIREETNRRPGLRKRQGWSWFAGGLGFAVLWFLFDRFSPFNEEPTPLVEAIISSIVVATLWSLSMWYSFARKQKAKDKNAEEG
ncbi:MAG: hypothetical protein WBQ23_02970 [Bacteroidota bacterium]